jgi:polyisoprenyl-phosphate glycosyltransferase
MNKETLISLALPAFNDATTVGPFLAKLSGVLASAYQNFEIVVVDNGSTDATSREVEQAQKSLANLRLIKLSRHYSPEIAIAACLENAIGDYVVLMDLRSDPVEMVLPFLERAQSGFHVVIGKKPPSQGVFFFRRWLQKLFYRMASRILGFRLHPMDSQFRVFSRQAVNSITRVRNKNRSLRYLNAMIGFETSYMEYAPVAGSRERHKPFLQAALSGIDMIVSNSGAPLRFASGLALLGCVMNLLYFGYILAVSLIKNRVAEGWITTNVSHTSMFLLLFIVLSILAEYIARILDETQDRPLYFVDYESSSNAVTLDPKTMKERLNVVGTSD